jgi:Clostridium epsilon toxin ETX/Bacillus mosquitocidal toxin MTX2
LPARSEFSYSDLDQTYAGIKEFFYMSVMGSTLTTGQQLNVGDYMVSNNGLFFALMQSDGNFCVYRGSAPAANFGFLWGSVQAANYSPAEGKHFVIMQGDGNFCGYKGSKTDQQAFQWGSVQLAHYQPGAGDYVAVIQDDGNFCVSQKGKTNPLFASSATDPINAAVDVEITSIVYDLANAKTLHNGSSDLYRQTVRNDSGVQQSSSISGTASVAETSGWSDALAVKVGVKTTFTTGIPFVFEGKVEVSAEVSNTYTWNGSETKTKTWGFNTPVNVPAHTIVVGLVSATLSTIAVPYTLTGTFTLKSGQKVPGQVKGIYTGSNSHDLTITFIEQSPASAQIRSTSKALVGTLK